MTWKKLRNAAVVELLVIVAIAVGLAFAVQAFVVKPYRIPSGSMEPTLTIGQRVLVNRIGTDFDGPHVGEVAVFHPPAGRRRTGVRTDAAHGPTRRCGVCAAASAGGERQLRQADRRRTGR